MTIKKKRHNKTNGSHLTQLEEKSSTLFSANSVFQKLWKKVKEKEEESYQESRNEKLGKLKVHDLRVDEKLFKKFLKKFSKILKNEKVRQKIKAHDGP